MGKSGRGSLTSTLDRLYIVEILEEAIESGARQIPACNTINLSVRTFQRWQKEGAQTADKRRSSNRPTPINKLSDSERETVMLTMNSPEFRNLPPSQVVPMLADRNIYIASESTIYRVLRAADLLHHRGRRKESKSKPLSTHYATAPNQLWSWDITYLPGPIKGVFFYLYLVMDIFSRNIVGWEIWTEESAENASLLIRKAYIANSISGVERPLVLHSDNGSPMKAATMLETLYQLGITPSRSRPRVSNDNPYSESLFHTCKYFPSYPSNGFLSIDAAREWMRSFTLWYRHEHRHSGIKFLTPYQRHSGKCKEVLANRISVYEAAKKRNPHRWSGKVRNWTIDEVVWLNPEKATAAQLSTSANHAS